MSTPLKLQAREIVRAAKRHNIQLTRMRPTVYNGRGCALAVVSAAMKTDYDTLKCQTGDHNFSMAVMGLEDGFEDFDVTRSCASDKTYKRYYKVGKNVAKMAGLKQHD